MFLFILYETSSTFDVSKLITRYTHFTATRCKYNSALVQFHLLFLSNKL